MPHKFSQGIPPQAKRVFKGVIFDVYQWEQELFDGRTATFEKLWRPDTVGVIPVIGDRILIQEQEQPDKPQPFISLPGGRCDGGEDPLEAVKRELLEETGYVSNDWELWRTEQPYGKIAWSIYTYIARDCNFEKEPELDGGEKIRTKLITFDELLSLSDEPTFRDKELIVSLLRMRLHAEEREKFRRLLFRA